MLQITHTAETVLGKLSWHAFCCMAGNAACVTVDHNADMTRQTCLGNLHVASMAWRLVAAAGKSKGHMSSNRDKEMVTCDSSSEDLHWTVWPVL